MAKTKPGDGAATTLPRPRSETAGDRAPVRPRLTSADDQLYERTWALAQNLWWSWQPEVSAIFRELDPVRWRILDHNPIALLSEFSFERLEQRASELSLHSRIQYAHRRLKEYLAHETTWGSTHAGLLAARPVAYFSAEFGIHESLPIYSGGLGVLAGDHVKSASDLGVPLVAVGLFYRQGYFKQSLDRDRWQREDYVAVDVEQLPIQPAIGRDGEPVCLVVETRSGDIQLKVWRCQVGRCTLLLLDADVEGNRMEDRELTSRLYGGDVRVRIRQELILGVGGVKALAALGIAPGALHLNEGHSAFAPLEWIRQRMDEDGLSFERAAADVAGSVVFTTHTPVEAGHDRFSADKIEEHLGPLRDALGLSPYELMALGRVHPGDENEPFCMTVLALKLSRQANAVSAEHGRVSRRMWQCLWPGRTEEEVPIGHITNGVHALTWLAPQMHRLYDRHFGLEWEARSGEPTTWQGIEQVDDGELWEVHQVLKARLLNFARIRNVRQAERRGEPAEVLQQSRTALDGDVLTIGFARRFATYKRANLILSDFARVLRMLTDSQRPIQLVFAGKAHPHDEPGKKLLWQIGCLCRDPRVAHRVVFIEDYDMNVGRHLVQGVDVWLNNPRRPMEASGTSGEKVVLNGGLNLSILDGWWAEAYDGHNGFAIGRGQTHARAEQQDARDASDLYEVLDREVVPLYYLRDQDGLPRQWIGRMKRAIRTLGWRFNANRMVTDYVKHSYLPAAGGLSCSMP